MKKIKAIILIADVSGNHSCVANTEVTFPHNNSMLAVCALQDIKAGEVCLLYQQYSQISVDNA